MTTPSPTSVNRTRLALLCGIGLVVMVVGSALPRLIQLPSMRQSAQAEPAGAGPAGPVDVAPEVKATIERILVAASLLVLAGVGVAWVFRRRRTAPAVVAPKLLSVAAAVPLPHGCCAVLMEVGDRRFLAGVDPSGIRSVIPLPTPTAEPAANSDPGPALLEIRA